MRSAIGAALALACIIGCGDDSAPNLGTTMPPATVSGPDESANLSGSPLYDRYGYCADQSDCLETEQCVVGTDDNLHVCLAPCEDVDDCVGPSIPVRTDFTAPITCSELEGAKRCVLSCGSADECLPGMVCSAGACVWN